MEDRLDLLLQLPGHYRLRDPVGDARDVRFILLSFPGVVRLGFWLLRGACMSW